MSGKSWLREVKSILASWILPPSQMNWVLEQFKQRRLDDIHELRAEVASRILWTRAAASSAEP
jgi:hypothetical protein